MADDENKPAEQPNPGEAQAPAPVPPEAPQKTAPRKPSVGDRVKQQQASEMIEGKDGKMHRKVPTVVKVKAFLVLFLPIAFPTEKPASG